MDAGGDDKTCTSVSLAKTDSGRSQRENSGSASAGIKPSTPVQEAINGGLPAWVGASAAMGIAGLPLGPALALGLLSGALYTFVSIARTDNQRPSR